MLVAWMVKQCAYANNGICICRTNIDLNLCLDVCHNVIRLTFKRNNSAVFVFLTLYVCMHVGHMYRAHRGQKRMLDAQP